jgi:hypothetical protein
LLACCALVLAAGCSADNPDYRAPGSGEAGAPLGAHDLAVSVGPRDLAGQPVLDLALPPPDLAVPPDLDTRGGPSADVAEDVANTWDVGESQDDNIVPCNPMKRGAVSLHPDPMHAAAGTQSVRVDYGPNASSYFQAVYPKSRAAGWNLGARKAVHFFVDAAEPASYGGWQPNGPTVVLCSPNGYRRLDPTTNQLPRQSGTWKELQVPLVGNGSWKSQDMGRFDITNVDSVEFHADPLRNTGMGTCSMWLDGVYFE